jgi:hypothetical protein
METKLLETAAEAGPARLIKANNAIILSVFMVCVFVGYGYSFKRQAKSVDLAFFNLFLRRCFGNNSVSL